MCGINCSFLQITGWLKMNNLPYDKLLATPRGHIKDNSGNITCDLLN